MPSTADDVLAEILSAALRAATVRLRRYGLDSLSITVEWYYAWMGLWKCSNAKRPHPPQLENHYAQNDFWTRALGFATATVGQC